ncbi:MAG: hypothetical protein KF757_03485 [Phycisphaeraceae bacterium]|nr:hypothetical protein [Phycisphaeraceae bacterium]MCW5763066.1 hypothetical protein [Phycisphaeraceae bacterium]
MLTRLCLVLIVFIAAPVCAQPVFLASYNRVLYRVTDGMIEAFPNQPGTIIGMTVVPPGASVMGAGAGEVLAVQGGAGNTRIWRVDNPLSGTPNLVHLGDFPENTYRNDITFAHGRLFGVVGGIISEYSTHDFSTLDVIDLERPNAAVGGMAFDGVETWYLSNQTSNRIIRLPDPPTPEGWTPLGPIGITMDNNDLDWFYGRLYLATYTSSTLVIGWIDLETGVFNHVVDVVETTSSGVVGLAILNPCQVDMNVDGVLDFFDVQVYLNLYSRGSPLADLNNDGIFDFFDVQMFLGLYSAGCA